MQAYQSHLANVHAVGEFAKRLELCAEAGRAVMLRTITTWPMWVPKDEQRIECGYIRSGVAEASSSEDGEKELRDPPREG